jgi:LysM repeat protein
MSDFRQVFWGLLAAMLSVVIIFGSLALSMAEAGVPIAQALTPTDTIIVNTPLPGEPTYTPSPTPLPTDTPTLPAPRTACAPPPGWQPIVVQFGDTFSSLAEQYSTTVEILKRENCLEISGPLPDGSIVFVPPLPPTPTSTATLTATPPPPPPPSATHCGPPRGWVLYTVQRGDTLSSISREVGVSVAQLQRANCLSSPDLIRAGSQIFVPRLPAPKPSATATQTISPSATFTAPSPTDTTAPTTEVPPTSRPSSTPTSTVTPSDTPTPTASTTPTPTLTATNPPPTTEPPVVTEPPVTTEPPVNPATDNSMIGARAN